MSFHWDSDAINKKMATYNSDEEKLIQMKIINSCNEVNLNNIDLIFNTFTLLLHEMEKIQDLRSEIILASDNFFNNNHYFNLPKHDYNDSIFSDFKKCIEFLEFTRKLEGDTVYFKFNS